MSVDNQTNGCVYLVGAGPGDPELMTLKGRTLVERADCIIYDALASPSMLGWAKVGCEKIYVGKRAGEHACSQAKINSLLVECSHKYLVTVRLKGEIPMFLVGGRRGAGSCGCWCPFSGSSGC